MKRLAEAQPTENLYYARISRKLRNAKYIALLLMVATAVLILWAYRGGLTYENLRYLLRDVDAAGHTAFSGDTVCYTASDTNTYLYFRDDLAVGSADGVAFHRALGNRSFADTVQFKAPVLVGSEKYMLAYDTGGYSFYVYNSISRVYSETLDTAIVSAAASDDGNFAILTRNKVGSCEIRVYDKNFAVTASLTRSGDVYTIGFFEDGRLWLCESLADAAALYTDFSIYTVGGDAIDGTHRESGLVLRSGLVKNGYYLLTDRSLVFLNDAGEKTAAYSFGTSDVLFADATADGVAVLLDDNTSGAAYSAAVYFANGEQYTLSVPKGAKGVALCAKRVCLLYDGTLTVYDGVQTKDIAIPAGVRAMLRRDKSSVIVCYNDYAKIFEVR